MDVLFNVKRVSKEKLDLLWRFTMSDINAFFPAATSDNGLFSLTMGRIQVQKTSLFKSVQNIQTGAGVGIQKYIT